MADGLVGGGEVLEVLLVLVLLLGLELGDLVGGSWCRGLGRGCCAVLLCLGLLGRCGLFSVFRFALQGLGVLGGIGLNNILLGSWHGGVVGGLLLLLLRLGGVLGVLDLR